MAEQRQLLLPDVSKELTMQPLHEICRCWLLKKKLRCHFLSGGCCRHLSYTFQFHRIRPILLMLPAVLLPLLFFHPILQSIGWLSKDARSLNRWQGGIFQR